MFFITKNSLFDANIIKIYLLRKFSHEKFRTKNFANKKYCRI